MSRQDNRSDAALRERLELAKKAVPKGESTLWMVDPAVPRDLCIRDAFNERILTMEGCTATATAHHIAASSPDAVRADIEEILRLRAENERLRGEVESLNKQADWLVMMLSHYTEDCPLKFSWLYAEELPIPKIDGCDGAWPDDDYFDCSNSTPEKCWRKAARKAVEEKERHG